MNRSPTRRTRRRFALAMLATPLALATSAPAWSQSDAAASYPSRPIEMIVAYAPGGGTDIIARLLARTLEKFLGPNAHIVVQNRPGAGGAIGFAELARATPDGYTIGFINTPNVLTIPIERKVTFSWRSYDLIGNLVDDPGGFSVAKDSPITDLKSLAAYAKAHPHEVTVGTTGTGSDDHLAMLLFQRASNTELTHIPYKGAGEVRQALQGKTIVVGAINVGEALQFQKGGTELRQLGSMSAKRTPLAADLPTFHEQGFDIELASLRGVAAPKGLPDAIRAKLVDAIAKAAADPEFQKQAEGLFAPLRYLAPQPYAAELDRGEQGFQQLWKDMPWQESKP